MKRKRGNSVLKYSSSKKHQSLFETKSTAIAAPSEFDLPDQCWEHVVKFLKHHEDNDHSSRDLRPLSVVSKYFLSVTNRLRFSLTIKPYIGPKLPCLLRRFPNLTSLNVNDSDLDELLIQLSGFPLNLTSFHLTRSYIYCLRSTEMSKMADCFPNLQLLGLNHCYEIHEEGIAHVLKTCPNIRHLNLASCSGVKLSGLNFEVPKLEVLNLSYTEVDDQTLDVISKNCRGLLQLVLEGCHNITKEGVMRVLENCTQLREINLKCCVKVLSDVVTSTQWYL